MGSVSAAPAHGVRKAKAQLLTAVNEVSAVDRGVILILLLALILFLIFWLKISPPSGVFAVQTN
jgi:hypothetical protein